MKTYIVSAAAVGGAWKSQLLIDGRTHPEAVELFLSAWRERGEDLHANGVRTVFVRESCVGSRTYRHDLSPRRTLDIASTARALPNPTKDCSTR